MKRLRLFGTEGVLSRTQLVLVMMIVLLVVALGSTIVIAYINLNTSGAFRAGYRIANLGNLQRGVIQLRMETMLILRDDFPNFELVESLRSELDTQLKVTQTEASNDEHVMDVLNNVQYLLEQYDYQLGQLSVDPAVVHYRSSTYQIDVILESIERQMQKLYKDRKPAFTTTSGTQSNNSARPRP